jgi:hypothetical protein
MTMEQAATAAADRQAALAARCVTDSTTLARVAAALHSQLGGTLPLLIREHVNTTGVPLERRTYTPLRRTRES